MEHSLKTGTTTISVKYNGGVIIAADKRVTVGHMIGDGKFEKVIPITDRIAITVAGMASPAKLFARYLKSEIRLNELRMNRTMNVKEVAELLASFQYSAIRGQGTIVHFIVSGVDETGPQIYDVFPDGTLTPKENFNTSGSGSVFVMGVLDAQYSDNMDESAAVKLVKQGFRAAMRNDSASGNGADIFKITTDGVQHLETLTVDPGITVE